MKYINWLLTVIFVLLTVNTSYAQDDEVITQHARIRLQSSSSDNGLGISGVIEVPDLTQNPTNILGLIGVGLSGKKYNIGLHLGSLINKEDIKAIIDVRGTCLITNYLFNWSNIRYTDVTNRRDSYLYVFSMFDFIVSQKVPIALGFESENTIFGYDNEYINFNDYSMGPNILLSTSDKLRFELSYQKHTKQEVGTQFWLRMDIKL